MIQSEHVKSVSKEAQRIMRRELPNHKNVNHADHSRTGHNTTELNPPTHAIL
jgi:hypothetical protein